MHDIVPELLQELENTLSIALENDRELQSIKKRIKQGTARSIDSERFSVRAGEVLSQVWKDAIAQKGLPDDRMYYNIASRLLDPTLHTGFNEVSAVCKDIIQSQYAAAGQPLSQVVAVGADFNKDRLAGLVDYISSKDSYAQAEPAFLEKMINFHQDIHSQTVEKNFDNLGQMGFTPKLIRKSAGKCCEWCQEKAGSYDYEPDMDREVFRKHSNCRCTVEYYPDGPRGRYQDVWTKQWGENHNKTKTDSDRQNSNQANGAGGLQNSENGQENTKHIEDRKEERDISEEDIQDTLNNPLEIGEVKIDQNGRKSRKIIGEKCTVYINPETGRKITVHKTHSKTVRKIKRKKGEEP